MISSTIIEDICDNNQIGEKIKQLKKSFVHFGEKLELSLIINYKQTQCTKAVYHNKCVNRYISSGKCTW